MNDTEKTARIKRMKYRANHRGIKEMDIILGGFAMAKLDDLDDEMVSQFEALMAEHDRDLLTWFTGEVAFPFQDLQPIFELVTAHTLEQHQNG